MTFSVAVCNETLIDASAPLCSLTAHPSIHPSIPLSPDFLMSVNVAGREGGRGPISISRIDTPCPVEVTWGMLECLGKEAGDAGMDVTKSSARLSTRKTAVQ